VRKDAVDFPLGCFAILEDRVVFQLVVPVRIVGLERIDPILRDHCATDLHVVRPCRVRDDVDASLDDTSVLVVECRELLLVARAKRDDVRISLDVEALHYAGTDVLLRLMTTERVAMTADVVALANARR
jgi:hypothetical protein